MHYKGLRKPLREIAEELGVEVMVEGSVAQADGRVRITAQLIDARTDHHLCVQTHDRLLRDILSVQAEVAVTIAQQIKLVLTALEQGQLALRAGG